MSVAVIMAAAKQTKPWLDRTRFLAPVDVVVTSGIPLSKVAIADDVRIEPVSVAVIMAAAKQLKPWRDRTRFLAPVAVVAAVVEPAPAFTVAVFVRTVVETGCNPLAKVAIADDVRIEPVSGAVIVAAQKQLKPWLDRTRFLGT